MGVLRRHGFVITSVRKIFYIKTYRKTWQINPYPAESTEWVLIQGQSVRSRSKSMRYRTELVKHRGQSVRSPGKKINRLNFISETQPILYLYYQKTIYWLWSLRWSISTSRFFGTSRESEHLDLSILLTDNCWLLTDQLFFALKASAYIFICFTIATKPYALA